MREVIDGEIYNSERAKMLSHNCYSSVTPKYNISVVEEMYEKRNGKCFLCTTKNYYSKDKYSKYIGCKETIKPYTKKDALIWVDNNDKNYWTKIAMLKKKEDGIEYRVVKVSDIPNPLTFGMYAIEEVKESDIITDEEVKKSVIIAEDVVNDTNLVKVEWEASATCDEYYTIWVTYTIGDKSIRKRARLYNRDFCTVYFTDRDFWAVLRFTIGDTIEHYREDGKITMNKLKNIIKDTEHFYSEDWGTWLHEFAWFNHYGNLDNNIVKEFMGKVRGEYKEETSHLVGMF